MIVLLALWPLLASGVTVMGMTFSSPLAVVSGALSLDLNLSWSLLEVHRLWRGVDAV